MLVNFQCRYKRPQTTTMKTYFKSLFKYVIYVKKKLSKKLQLGGLVAWKVLFDV